jgi:uncharacterized protein
MNLPDVNFWLALTLSKHAHHSATRGWLENESEPSSLHFCRSTQTALLRLLTTAAVFSPYGNPPLTNREAWSVYAQFKRDDRIAFVEEPAGLEATWKLLATRKDASPKLWMDAYLAAFAMTGELRLVTFDHGFKSFTAQGLELLLLKP